MDVYAGCQAILSVVSKGHCNLLDAFGKRNGHKDWHDLKLKERSLAISDLAEGPEKRHEDQVEVLEGGLTFEPSATIGPCSRSGQRTSSMQADVPPQPYWQRKNQLDLVANTAQRLGLSQNCYG